MSYLSADLFSEIKAALPAETVLTHYLGAPRLRRWHCAFHQPDKHPSMTTKHGGIVCWSCAWRGDLFKFIEQHQGVSRGEALKIAADLAGVSLPKKDERGSRRPAIAATMGRIRRECRQIERDILDHAKKAAALAWRRAWELRQSEEVWEAIEVGAWLDRRVEIMKMEISGVHTN